MVNNYEKAEEIEDYIREKLNKKGIELQYHDVKSCDFCAYGELLEIKSASIANKNGKRKGKQLKVGGRFDFTNKDQLKYLKENNAWVIFVTNYGDQRIIIGALKASELPNRRYFSIPWITNQKALFSWKEIVNKILRVKRDIALKNKKEI